jgi:hypothetical protein
VETRYANSKTTSKGKEFQRIHFEGIEIIGGEPFNGDISHSMYTQRTGVPYLAVDKFPLHRSLNHSVDNFRDAYSLQMVEG